MNVTPRPNPRISTGKTDSGTTLSKICVRSVGGAPLTGWPVSRRGTSGRGTSTCAITAFSAEFSSDLATMITVNDIGPWYSHIVAASITGLSTKVHVSSVAGTASIRRRASMPTHAASSMLTAVTMPSP